jgi:putative ABC transport system permease protein
MSKRMSWTRFFRRRRWDEERSRELEAYLEAETSDNIARGMPPETARGEAHRKLGNRTQIREEIYRMNTAVFFDGLWQDLRYAARSLRRSPGFAAVAIASLALGVGANTAIFQLLNTIRLRTLPVHHPEELGQIRITDPKNMRGSINSDYGPLTNAIWERVRDTQQGFSGVFAWSGGGFNLAAGGQAHYARGLWVSGAFFETLGVRPILGRVFNSREDRPGCGSSGVVIGYGFWQKEFGGDVDVIGRKLLLDNHPFEIVGVTSANFFGLDVGRSYDVALLLCSEPLFRSQSIVDLSSVWWLSVMGRVKRGWTMERAGAELAAASPGIFEATIPANYPARNRNDYLGYRLGAFPAGRGVSSLREEYSNPLWSLLAITGIVLLIACANLANLMLARASAREREIAVRLAIGASRVRVMRHVLAESLLLAGSGALAAIFVAGELSRFLVAFLSTEGNELAVNLAPDGRVLAFTAGLAIVTCVLFGLAPALRAGAAAPESVLRSGGRGLTPGRQRFGLRRALVASQIALSLVLLVGALLFSRSLRNLLTLDAGFRQDGILIAWVDFVKLGVPVDRRVAFRRDILDRLRASPGVDCVSDVRLLMGDGSESNRIWIDGADPRRGISPNFNHAGADYFKTLGVPFVAGRDFDARDTVGSPRVVIVNEAFARALGLGPDAVGKRIRREVTPSEPEKVFEIVGVVKNTKYRNLREDFVPIGYYAASQDIRPSSDDQILIRSHLSLAALTASVRRTIGQINPEITFEFRTFKAFIGEGLLRERLMATLSGFFGLLAGVLAAVGLYGVISYMVARRRNEIGIRIALGARRGQVLALIFRESALLLAIGLAAGTVLALAAGKTAASLLFGLKPYDPVTLVLATGALAAIAAAATYLPARRAADLDPTAALREE